VQIEFARPLAQRAIAEELEDATATRLPGVDVIDASMVVVTLAEVEPTASPDALARALLGPIAEEPATSIADLASPAVIRSIWAWFSDMGSPARAAVAIAISPMAETVARKVLTITPRSTGQVGLNRM